MNFDEFKGYKVDRSGCRRFRRSKWNKTMITTIAVTVSIGLVSAFGTVFKKAIQYQENYNNIKNHSSYFEPTNDLVASTNNLTPEFDEQGNIINVNVNPQYQLANPNILKSIR